jgi:outer membrane protein OmpA-like peptidoglycan-associated protein
MSTMRNTILIAGASFGMACATASPPNDLLQARSSYQRASQGPAATHNPADVHTAKRALDAAEHSFLEDGATQKTTDLAYIAERRSRIAEVRSSAKQYTDRQQKTLENMHAAERSQVRSTTAQLGRANDQLALQGQAMKTQDEKMADEKLRREEAEKRLAQATADLAKFASVKQEERGMVITLSGGVLFASAKSELLPAAVLKLNTVAEALTQQDPDSKMVVEGHTDSQGAAGYNQDLSQRRADAVRNHLVGRGIAADRVTSQGFGLSRPIADNTSTEGRANNRRVEIVVQK